MRSKCRLPRSGWALSTLLIGTAALLNGAPAHADSTAHPAAGVLRVPNARVVTATPAQVEQVARLDGRAQGLRAYVDPETGTLRDQTPEEMFMTPEVFQKSQRGKSLAKSARSPSGGYVVETDESVVSYSLVARDGQGRLRMQCVTGEQAARSALARGIAKEDRHDH